MNNSSINELSVTIINVLIIPLLPVFTSFLIALMRKKIAEIEKNIKNQELVNYIQLAENAAATAVMAVSQTYVDDLKKANGSLTIEQQKTALQMAKDKALLILGEAGANALQAMSKDLDAWLENKIECYVGMFKNPNAQLSIPRITY